MDATEKGLAVIRSFEGRALRAYRDEVGVWTIGYGITNYDEFAVQQIGPIRAGLTITEAQAESLLRDSLSRKYAPGVAKAMPGAQPNENDAGLSFHFNTGAIAKASWVQRWRSKASAESIRAGLMSWNKAGGKVLAGLTRRRAREADMILKGDYGPEGRTAAPALDAAGKPIPATSADHALAGTPGMLRRGDKGPEVKDLNAALALIGFDVNPDSDQFDGKTEAAVRKFQNAHPQLTMDGIVGPATDKTIQREADAKRKSKKVIGGTAGPAVILAGTQAAGHAHLSTFVWVLVVLAVLGAITYVGYRYRDEVRGIVNRA